MCNTRYRYNINRIIKCVCRLLFHSLFAVFENRVPKTIIPTFQMKIMLSSEPEKEQKHSYIPFSNFNPSSLNKKQNKQLILANVFQQ